MKTKQRNICQACRKGKISCDGKKPSCTQCSWRARTCPGYSSDWTFIPQAAHNGRVEKTRRGTRRQETAEQQDEAEEEVKPHPQPKDIMRKPSSATSTASGVAPLCDLITTITSNYVPEPEDAIPSRARSSTRRSKRSSKRSVEPAPRICGAWVEVLLELVGSDTNTPLAAAIEAFAMSLSSRGPKRTASISAGYESYDKALRSVNDALQCQYDSFPVEIAAAVMCLLLAELFMGTSLTSWIAHLGGLGKLMQASRPETYVSGIPHRLYVGARPGLLVLAFMSRKSSFLASEEWKSIPFRETPPSPVQTLVSEAAAIPSIFERLDANDGKDIAKEALDEFKAVLARLDSWEHTFLASTDVSTPLFWREPTVKPSEKHARPRICFHNITAANALTHLWAFKVICFRNIGWLSAPSPPTDSDNPPEATHSVIKRLSEMICESTEYLMQDRMKLFGPSSVVLPLRTAYEVFEAGGLETKEEFDWCKGIVADIHSQGHDFMSLFFEVPSLGNGPASEVATTSSSQEEKIKSKGDC